MRANLDWPRFLDIKIPVPDIETQRHLVEVWKGLDAIKMDNEALASPLMNLCMSYLDRIKRDYPTIPIRELIQDFDARNINDETFPVFGLNRDKKFIPTVANLNGIDLRKYKVVQKGDFVFSGMQTGRDNCIRLGLYTNSIPALISPAYSTFTITNSDISPQYFYLYFLRKELDRYGAFISDSSVRANLDWSRFTEIHIPVPPLSIQQAIVDIYTCARESREIAVEAGELSKQACPALIRRGTCSIAS